MIQTKEKLANHVTNICKQVSPNKEIISNYCRMIQTQYNIPKDVLFDLFTLRTDPFDETEFVLFCVLDIVDHDHITKFFTPEEISKLKELKYKTRQIKFPIRFKMLQVSDNQWIGATSVQELMSLRDAQLIKYNENTQRTLKRMVENGVEYYSYSLNRTAVNSIDTLFETNMYIPNTITLNIPEDTEFIYDGNDLVIKEISAFDIVDGYHRYIAMSNRYIKDNKFDYPMELRIICFSEEKAQQFIYQEDQKTKMDKVESNSFNQNNPGNQIAQMLNQKDIFTGLITKTTGIIDAITFANAIDAVYFGSSKSCDRKEIIGVRNKVFAKLSELVDAKPDILDSKWKNQYINIVVVASNTDSDIMEFSDRLYGIVMNDTELRDMYSTRALTKSLANRLLKL